MALTVGSLFSGIGGIDLGLERAGMVTRWFCEIDPHCRNVLARHWPGLPIYGDITAIDWDGVERVDVLAGGFPCQPVSVAGRQRAQEDERWLWPEFERAIRALRPRYVLVENVRNLLAVNGGSAFSEVLAGLASCGYDAEWDCIPASAIGAPHRRDRLWLLAYSSGTRRWENASSSLGDESQDAWRATLNDNELDRDGEGSEPVADSHSSQWTKRRQYGKADLRGVWRSPMGDTYYAGSQGQRRLGECAREQSAWADGEALPDGRLAPPSIPRVAHGIPHRVERLRSIGNAVVPQVVEYIGRRIVAFDAERELAA